MIRFISDIHGNYRNYTEIIRDIPNTIQLGDFGIGFGNATARNIDAYLDNIPGNNRFIRGNHDNPAEAKLSKHWIPDGTVENNMMFVGGALSIDRIYRTENVDWWNDEELSYEELIKIIELYEKVKPEIMVTHEFPEVIAQNYLIPAVHGFTNFSSRTRNVFDNMFAIHQPKIWIGGHWHTNMDIEVENTRFICIQELGYIDLDL